VGPGRVEVECSELVTYSRRPSIDSWSICGPPVSRVPSGWVAGSNRPPGWTLDLSTGWLGQVQVAVDVLDDLALVESQMWMERP
jgi:hypothetical protein